MNGVSGDLILFAKRGVLNDVEGAWVLLGIGILMMAVAVWDFLRGRTRISYRGRFGIGRSVDVNGEDNPLTFLAHVMIMLLIGTALITSGVWRLVG